MDKHKFIETTRFIPNEEQFYAIERHFNDLKDWYKEEFVLTEAKYNSAWRQASEYLKQYYIKEASDINYFYCQRVIDYVESFI